MSAYIFNERNELEAIESCAERFRISHVRKIFLVPRSRSKISFVLVNDVSASVSFIYR